MIHCLFARPPKGLAAPELSIKETVAVVGEIDEVFCYYPRRGAFSFIGVSEKGEAYGYDVGADFFAYEDKGEGENVSIVLDELFKKGLPDFVGAFHLSAETLFSAVKERLIRDFSMDEDRAERFIQERVAVKYAAEGKDVHFSFLEKAWSEALKKEAARFRGRLEKNREVVSKKEWGYPNPKGIFIGAGEDKADELLDQGRKLYEDLLNRPTMDVPDLVLWAEGAEDEEMNRNLFTAHKVKLVPEAGRWDLFLTEDPFLIDLMAAAGVATSCEADLFVCARHLRKEKEEAGGAGYEFHVYAPWKEAMYLYLYDDAQGMDRTVIPMEKREDTFYVQIPMERLPVYYNFGDGEEEYVDPYAKALSLNGRRGYAFDGIESYFSSDYVEKKESPVIYELHVKDFTYELDTKNPPGTFSALGESVSIEGADVGFDHLRSLGVDYVHLLPVHNFLTVFEQAQSRGDEKNYNWGYDPDHYFALENSYAADPADPTSALDGLTHWIQKAHAAGIGVILDVVYNHLYLGEKSAMARLYPAAVRRFEDGSLSNGSGTGSEVATEEKAVRKLILASIEYFQKLGVDGFRFDLCGLIDNDTMAAVERAAYEKNPNALLYGEPWRAAESVLDESLRLKTDERATAFFDDDYRNGLRGDSFSKTAGWVGGNFEGQSHLLSALLGGGKYRHNLAYVSCHDDLVLGDFLDRAMEGAGEEDKERAAKLAIAFLMLTPGPILFGEGDEYLRRRYRGNPYRGPASAVALHWEELLSKEAMDRYVKDLIRLRRKTDLFQHEVLIDEPGFIVLKNKDRIFSLNATENVRPMDFLEERGYKVLFNERGAVEEELRRRFVPPKSFVAVE
ncbi:MAG: hypothetical protein SOW18_05435 [Peptoniphilus sp.]|nr:hypothetical protein [Peptoniphilus sp.]MDY3118961.1 hypothetical protein [Peptoniphilus sp.]